MCLIPHPHSNCLCTAYQRALETPWENVDRHIHTEAHMSTRPKLDFQAIKQAAPIVKVAQLLNLDLKRDTGGFRCPCTSGRGNDRAIKITPGYQNKDGTLGAFYCHACRASGDCIALYAHIRDVDNYEAAQAISKEFGIAGEPAAAPKPAEAHARGLQPLDYLDVHNDVLELLGLSPEVCGALGAGYAGKGTMNGRVLIPLRMETGELVGYLGIATKADQNPLLKFPDNLDERCGVAQPIEAEEPPIQTPKDELRKLLRVV